MRSGSRPRQQIRQAGPFRSSRGAMSTLLPVVVVLILLPLIAFASSPDPWWIAGIYDGGDGDDIVTLVYETAGRNATTLSHVAPLPYLAELSLEGTVRDFAGNATGRGPRAPPTVGARALSPCSTTRFPPQGPFSCPRVDHQVPSAPFGTTSIP